MENLKSSSLRLGLAVFALTILLVGGYFWRQYEQQQSAVAEIEDLGGTVLPLQQGPDWLRRVFGDRMLRMLGGVYLVNLRGTSATDSDLAALDKMPGLQRLNLSQTDITDAGLVHLRSLTDLRALDLSGTRITDAGLTHLSTLTRLEYLYLDQTAVTDAGLSQLSGLPNLRHLSLQGTEAGEAAEILE